MTGVEIVNEIVGIITSGITNFATGLGSGIQAFAKIGRASCRERV